MSSQGLLNKINQGLTALGEEPEAHPVQLYLDYLMELDRWNKTYNLTAIRDVESMIPSHLFDSLSVLPYLNGESCLDVGTGAGLPGMILALARPDTHWVLLDSKVKKVRFLQHILQVLKPGNVEIVHARVEEYQPIRRFDTIITRALASLPDFHGLTSHLRDDDSHLLAMKGKYPQQELAELGDIHREIHKLQVPGLASDRFLIIIK